MVNELYACDNVLKDPLQLILFYGLRDFWSKKVKETKEEWTTVYGVGTVPTA